MLQRKVPKRYDRMPNRRHKASLDGNTVSGRLLCTNTPLTKKVFPP
jgi:hypothetical protein